ncbi:MAG: glycine/betaine ABC transporter permease, partial [Hyphomicrobiaceae bacterium]
MGSFDGLFNALGLREWCDAGTKEGGTMSMADLLAKSRGASDTPWYELSFPSLDNLNKSCAAVPRSRDMTSGVEQAFLDIKDPLKFVLDPITQPLSWLLDGSLYLFGNMPWWVLIPIILLAVQYVARSAAVTIMVAVVFFFMAFI